VHNWQIGATTVGLPDRCRKQPYSAGRMWMLVIRPCFRWFDLVGA
jgi:hypothetical protein